MIVIGGAAVAWVLWPGGSESTPVMVVATATPATTTAPAEEPTDAGSPAEPTATSTPAPTVAAAAPTPVATATSVAPTEIPAPVPPTAVPPTRSPAPPTAARAPPTPTITPVPPTATSIPGAPTCTSFDQLLGKCGTPSLATPPGATATPTGPYKPELLSHNIPDQIARNSGAFTLTITYRDKDGDASVLISKVLYSPGVYWSGGEFRPLTASPSAQVAGASEAVGTINCNGVVSGMNEFQLQIIDDTGLYSNYIVAKFQCK